MIFRSKQRKLKEQQEDPLDAPVGKTITVTIASEYLYYTRQWEARWCRHFSDATGPTREAAVEALIPKIVRCKRLEALEEEKEYTINY